MLDALKPLLESGLVNEETRQAIQEAWSGKLQEAREEIRNELREEFAQRYDHDKTVMVEALDRMVTDKLMEEIKQVQAEKLALAEDRVKFQTKMRESSSKFNDFMVQKLAEELGELRKDRKTQNESVTKLETFVMHALAREITEFAKDKKAVVESKVRLVAEARKQLSTLKKRFVKESSSKLSRAVTGHLNKELTQLQEDIKIARENSFGRRIFEAFATEFGATHLNEKVELKKLMTAVKQKETELSEARAQAQKAKALVESKEREIRVIRESNDRQKSMEELLGPLNKEKAQVMRDLLENVQTSRLKSAFEKYLPAVLAESTPAKEKKMIAESRGEVTGDKSAKVVDDKGSATNIIEIKRLAGL
jgi:hypothetical protein